MKRGLEAYYWQTNKDWYKLNEDKKLVLTEKAPEKAKRSFELWQKIRY